MRPVLKLLPTLGSALRLVPAATCLLVLTACDSAESDGEAPAADAAPPADASHSKDATSPKDASQEKEAASPLDAAAEPDVATEAEAAAPVDASEAEAPLTGECGNGVTEGAEKCDEGIDNGTYGHCRADCSAMPKLVAVRGDVFAFMSEVQGERLDGVTVNVMEHPEFFAIAGADAHFEIDGLEEGTDVTLVASRTGYVTTQTATFKLGPRGIDPFSIQMPSSLIFGGMLFIVGDPQFDKYCAIVTTVTRLGGSLFMKHRQGEAGSQLAILPAVPAESGPIYFNESVLPDEGISATTVDGGAFYRHVPPGDYVVTGTKAGVGFQPLRIKCSVGTFINAGPTMGLQANAHEPDYAGASLYADDAYTASMDGLCEKTAACVNENVSNPPRYPDATLLGCKKAMRNELSWIDPTCDAKAHVRDAWKAFYDCRAADCTNALGKSEEVCTAEEAAFTSAMASYGPCYKAAHGF